MPRPRKPRRVHQPPLFTEFKPLGVGGRFLEEVILTIDEYEAFRLADYMKLSHEEAAEEMEISRPTFTRLLETARGKVATALIEGKLLRIEGGNINYRHHLVRCLDCGQMFSIQPGEFLEHCPNCNSTNLINIGHGRGPHGYGRGRGHGHGRNRKI